LAFRLATPESALNKGLELSKINSHLI